MAPDPAEQTALFRYRVIAEALSDRLNPAERGLLVRELAAHAHELPDGSREEFSRATLDRWVRAYRESGLDGLRPQPRSLPSPHQPCRERNHNAALGHRR